jgi:hypothetical protein
MELSHLDYFTIDGSADRNSNQWGSEINTWEKYQRDLKALKFDTYNSFRFVSEVEKEKKKNESQIPRS